LVQLTLNADDVLVRIIIPVKYFRTKIVYKAFCQAILSSNAIEYNSNGLILVMSPDVLALFTEVIKVIIEIMARKSYKKIILMGLRKGNLDCLSFNKNLTNDRNIQAWQDILSIPNKICSPWHGRVVKSLWTQKINYGNKFYSTEDNPKPSLHKLKYTGLNFFHFILLIFKTMIALIPIVGFIFCCCNYIIEEKVYLKRIKKKVKRQAEEQQKCFPEIYDKKNIKVINDLLNVNSGKALGILFQRNIFRVLNVIMIWLFVFNNIFLWEVPESLTGVFNQSLFDKIKNFDITVGEKTYRIVGIITSLLLTCFIIFLFGFIIPTSLETCHRLGKKRDTLPYIVFVTYLECITLCISLSDTLVENHFIKLCFWGIYSNGGLGCDYNCGYIPFTKWIVNNYDLRYCAVINNKFLEETVKDFSIVITRYNKYKKFGDKSMPPFISIDTDGKQCDIMDFEMEHNIVKDIGILKLQ